MTGEWSLRLYKDGVMEVWIGWLIFRFFGALGGLPRKPVAGFPSKILEVSGVNLGQKVQVVFYKPGEIFVAKIGSAIWRSKAQVFCDEPSWISKEVPRENSWKETKSFKIWLEMPPINITPLKTNMSSENQWLEDVFPSNIVPFLVVFMSFQGCKPFLWRISTDFKPLRMWLPTSSMFLSGGFKYLLFSPRLGEVFAPIWRSHFCSNGVATNKHQLGLFPHVFFCFSTISDSMDFSRNNPPDSDFVLWQAPTPKHIFHTFENSAVKLPVKMKGVSTSSLRDSFKSLNEFHKKKQWFHK